MERLSPQRRAALTSVAAAATLLVLKLVVGLTSHSLGLISEAAHSGVDLVAALLTFFALRVSARPADVTHQFGHGKAEHLSALAEAAFLALASVLISARAIERLVGLTGGHVDAAWYVFVVVGLVIAVDASRTIVSFRTSRRYHSPALGANALHFGSDMAGSIAVLVGLLFARAGHPDADAIAALFVGVIVLLAAARMITTNVDVLMDRASAAAETAARAAIAALSPAVELRRLRMRQAAGRQFADVVIGVEAGAAVGQGHAAADAVEDALEQALPGSDVVVHVEPLVDDSAIRERVHAAAIAVPRVREVHNLAVVDIGGRTELSLHVKLPGDLTLDEAHEIADHVEQAIRRAVPEIDGVQTHLEPLAETSSAREVDADSVAVVRIVEETTGAKPRALRFLRTEAGIIAFLTLGLAGSDRLAEAHAQASRVEEQIRRELPDIADVVVHTEP